MKKVLFAMSTAALLGTAAIAGENSSGAYIGLGFGSTGYADDKYVKDEENRADLDKTDKGYTLYGGYQFNNIIAVEGSYKDYGTFSAEQDYSQSATVISASANVGYSFLDGQLRPFALLGLGLVDLDIKNSTLVVDDTGVSVHYGMGVQYEPDALIGFGLRLAYEEDFYAIKVEKPSEDETYGQALGMLYLGVQYKF
jgi:opacity protein-like surface antigen